MNQLTVLFLNSWYPNEVSSQNGNFIQQHARAVSLFCNVVALHVQSKNQKKEIAISKKYNKNVFEVIVYYKKINTNHISSSITKKKQRHKAYLKGYEQILKEFKSINMIHLNVILPAGFFALYLNKKYNIPFVITEHSTVFLDSNPLNHNFIEKYFVKKITKKASAICPVSIDLKNALIKYGVKGNYKTIPNVVDTNLFHYNRNKNSNKLNILHVSTLVDAHKNIKGILNVIKKISKIRNDFFFHIVGDGDIEGVKNYAKKIELESNIYTIDSQKPLNEIAKLMQKSHLFLLFSNYENLPCVISESLVSGVPVLSSNVGGIAEMISKKNGVLVNAKKEQELLESLDSILSNLVKYNGKEIAKNAILKYSYKSVGQQYLDLYNKILKF